MTNPYMVGPDYASLSNLELIVDATGLTVGATNDYGTVDGSGNVTALKSLAPGPTGRDFASNGTAPTLSNGGIVFGGSGRLRSLSAATVWNFLHFNATYANFRSTVHAVVKFGTVSNPDAAYGLLGTNAASNANRGVTFFWDDRASQSRNNSVAYVHSAGGTNNLDTRGNDSIPANTLGVWSIETRFDPIGANFRQLHFWNGRLMGVNVTINSTTLVTTPSFTMEIGACGNGVASMVGVVREIIIQSGVEDGRVRHALINGLIVKHGIDVDGTVTPTVDATRTSTIYDTVSTTGKYHLSTCIAKNPVRPWIITRSYREDDQHVSAGNSTWVTQKSVNNGVTWGAASTFISPTGGFVPVDGGGGYDHLGRLHIFVDMRPYVGSSPSGNGTIYHYYSDDDGDTWSAAQDLTSVIPSDGLVGLAAYGNMIENGPDVLMFPYYKATNWTDVTQSANYLLRSTDRGATWTTVVVRSPASTYINEITILAVSSTKVICIARNEATKEWSYSSSTDNGLTWSAFSDVTFGETLTTTAGPGRLTKFHIDSSGTPVDCVAFWFTNRETAQTKVVYGTASAIAASDYTGFIQSTKTTLINTGRMLHYFDVTHPMGNFNAIASGGYEQNPIDLSDNDQIAASILSTQYATVKTALGL